MHETQTSTETQIQCKQIMCQVSMHNDHGKIADGEGQDERYVHT